MALNVAASRDGSSAHQTRQRLSGWLDRALRKSGLNRRTAQPPPSLPSSRPRPITPADNLPCHPQTQSAFFSCLPPEIRQAILLRAFGDRTIHMQLTLDHPPLLEDSSSVDGGHGGLARRRDHSAPRQWLWQSCDCHRNPPWLSTEHFYWYRLWHRPEYDTCMQGKRFCCAYWSQENPPKCRVGVLGWLRSCRRA